MTATLKRKQFAASAIKLTEGSRQIHATINTSAVDRDREVVLPAGANLAEFERNPVILLGHRADQLPIGRATKLKRHPDAITATIQIATGPRGDEVLSLFQGEFLKAFSIGFDPHESSPPTRDEIRKRPDWAAARLVHRKWTLLEVSVVSVPANPEALAMAVSKGTLHLSEEMMNLLNEHRNRPRRVKLTQAHIVDAINRRLDWVTCGRYNFSK